MILRSQSFGATNFAGADLGDERRTKRLVIVADSMSRRPGGTLPQKLNNPGDLKAFYRLMDCDRVTHESVFESHRRKTLDRIEQMEAAVLVLHDSTELDYTTHLSLADELGQIGNGRYRGYIAHNSLAVDAKTGSVLGLTNQVMHHRVKVPPNEKSKEKRSRESRESLLWLRGTDPLPSTRKIVDVCDQARIRLSFSSMNHKADGVL